jgi:hypothetical protein
MVILRAFRAIDDPESCHKFIDGHERVLSSIGIKKISSSKEDWMFNPAAYVLVVEDIETREVLGGARVHAYGGTQDLPIEAATGYLDENVYTLVKDYAKKGTGEICGLRNSRRVAGLGFGSVHLTRAAVAISGIIGLDSLFALCAPYTIKTAEVFGYEKDHSVGNDGTFYYPKLDLIATVMILKDNVGLGKATDYEKNRIVSLREDRSQIFTETDGKREVEIQYELNLTDTNEFKAH